MTNHFCLVLYDYPCDMDQGGENSIWVARHRHSQGDLGGHGHSKIFIKYSHFVP